MKIEKLRKNHKKELVIGTILTVVIGGALTYKLTHSKYRVTQSIDLGSGVINYKEPDFKIMAMYKNDGSGDVSIDTVPTSGYTLNTSKSNCKVGDELVNGITINYHDGIIGIDNLSKKGTKCYLYFDKQLTGGDYILANVTVKKGTPDFSAIADTDEGVYSTSDGMYDNKTTYYWRGAVTNNHIIFANKCWRIVRINGDKTIRLIYNGPVQSENTCKGNGANAESIAVANQIYNEANDLSEYIGWTYIIGSQRALSGTDSNAKKQTDDWYNNNIGNNSTYGKKVADGKFCNDRNVANGYTWHTQKQGLFYYAMYDRINNLPELSCLNDDTYILKAGAITADEVMLAGGKNNTTNKNYYLYNDTNYWTMTPYQGGLIGPQSNNIICDINKIGQLDCISSMDSGNTNIRPVINLKADTTFSSGNGLQNCPYVVSN